MANVHKAFRQQFGTNSHVKLFSVKISIPVMHNRYILRHFTLLKSDVIQPKIAAAGTDGETW